jgi:flagellar biosynthesis protein FlhG
MLVVNQAASHAEGMETFHRISHVARKFLGRELALGGVIPFDEAVGESVTRRTPVVLTNPDSPAARAMSALASRVGVFHGRSQRAGQPFASRLRRLLASPPLGAAGA